MAAYFFDSSALAKRHLAEAGHGWVRSLIRAKDDHRIYLARVTAVEVVAAITRRQSGGHLSPAQAGAIIGHLRRHLREHYHVIELTPAHFDAATVAARKHRLRAYDAVQLAVALGVRRFHQSTRLDPVTFVSADRELNAAAITEGLPVEDPNAH